MIDRVGQRFDTLTGQNYVAADPQLSTDLTDIHRTYNDIPGLYPDETVNAVNGAADSDRGAISARRCSKRSRISDIAFKS